MLIKPELFTVERLLAAMLDHMAGNDNVWRQLVEIVPEYMPPFPRPDTKPVCVVRYERSFLRYSKGPSQGYFWDMYGDDMQSPELALLALLQAPVPPAALSREVYKKVFKRE